MAELMYDQFKLIEKKQLNSDDINSLTKLYLPLMGIDSYSLYIALSSLDVNVFYNYKTLIDILNFRGVKNINLASNKLEALGLLDVYVNNDKNYIYIINRPMSQREFLKEESLRVLLSSEIGEEQVLKLISEVKYELKGYKKISKSFEDIYDVKIEGKFDIIDKLLPSKFEIKNEEFNYSLFKMLTESSFITNEKMEENEFKTNILRISSVYKLDEEQMKDVVVRSIDIDGNTDYATLSANARRIFRQSNKEKEPRIVTKENDAYLQSIKDDEQLRLFDSLENIDPYDFLKSLVDGKVEPALYELKLIEDLVNNTKFPRSVIYLMILYAGREKDGRLPNYAYFEKVANTWARAKIKNVYDAYRYLEKQRDNANKENKTKYIKKERVELPEWYETYCEELDKKLETGKNEEYDDSILDELKKLLGD